jgi:hypothetical protein
MTSSPKKPGVAFWITIALVAVLVGYPLSFGPAAWLTGRGYFRESTISWVYWPILWSTSYFEPLEYAVDWWGSLCVPDGKTVTLEIETDETYKVFWLSPPRR